MRLGTGCRGASGHRTRRRVRSRAWGRDPGDEEILRRSVEEERILVTLDKDFGELVFVLGRPHGGIMRLVNVRAREQGGMILHALSRFGSELERNALVVVEADRIRVRMPDADSA